jgi:predicted dehydrogenase
VRFALFGTGHWARATHGPALVAHPGVDLVGVWGRDPGRTGNLARDLGTQAFADSDELIEAVEAVAVALPPALQAPLAVRAARAGRHLLLDKPLATAVAAADAVVDEVTRARVASVVFFTGRFTPAVGSFIAGAAGREWHGGRATMISSALHPGSPYAGSQWRHEYGGLWDVGPHALAHLLPVLGPVRDVAAMAGPRATTQVLCRHESGAVSHLELGIDAPQGTGVTITELYGPDGTVAFPPYDVSGPVAFGRAIDELLAMIAAGQSGHPCDVRFGRDVVAVLAADAAARVPVVAPLPRQGGTQ